MYNKISNEKNNGNMKRERYYRNTIYEKSRTERILNETKQITKDLATIFMNNNNQVLKKTV